MSERRGEMGLACGVFLVALAGMLLTACESKQEPAPEPAAEAPAEPEAPNKAASVREKAKPVFGTLPAVAESPKHPRTDALVTLGKQLYFEKRLSKNHDLACNSCHDVSAGGADTRPESIAKGKSLGHNGAFGGRNAPTAFNAALHISQFWDGRAEDVEAQAKGPILEGVEMAMPDEKTVVKVLESIPGYEAQFKAAYPDAEAPITYTNMADAIGAYERGFMTPGPFDEFLAGKDTALNEAELDGLATFMDAGCIACHNGPAIGGGMYQKLGLLKPYETEDTGRHEHTKNDADKYFFKVPGLRNIEQTGPYMHDGAIKTLEQMVGIMSEHQTPGGKLSAADTSNVVAFLKALTGAPPADYVKPPTPHESGPKTPKPDPT